RIQVRGERRGDVPAGGAQRGLGEGDGLPVLPHEQRLVDEQRDHIGPEPPVPARLRQPQRLVEVPLGQPVGVGVVCADPGDRHQPAGGPVQLAAGGVGVAAAQQRRGLGVEEPDDPGTRGYAARLAVHLLVVGAGRPQHLDVGHADLVPPTARDVHVLRRVLPLPHGHHGGRPGDGGSAEHMRALLLVGPPQGGGPLHEPRETGAVLAGRLTRHAEPDVVEGDGPVQPRREHLADQVGHLPSGPLPLQPPCHGGVFVPQRQPSRASRLVDVRGESGVRDTGLVENRVEQGVGLHGGPPVARCRRVAA
ncbi:hypothetical protein STRIP9103_01615, partial [Streptomyces ipomoeae 91-03]